MKLIGIFTTAAFTTVVVAAMGGLAFVSGVYIGMQATESTPKTATQDKLIKIVKDNT